MSDSGTREGTTRDRTGRGPAPRRPRRRTGSAAVDDQFGPRSATVRSLARSADEQLGAMTGRTTEGVVSVRRTEEGWTFGVEVVEVHRIPETTDVLAVYDVEMSREGELTGYRRRARYVRCRAGDE